MAKATMSRAAESSIPGPLKALRELELMRALALRGAVLEVGDGVAQVAGLDDVGFEELVFFDSGALGMAYDLMAERTGVVLLSGGSRVRAGEGVRPSGQLPWLTVGESLLGRVVDPLGRPLDDLPPPSGAKSTIFRRSPALTARAPVQRPLHTGLLVIDAAIPIGRGQRQLVLGDRSVGKTALVLDVIAAQQADDVICVYVMIGQPTARLLSVREVLSQAGALANTVLIAADAGTSPGLQYLAPYAGASVAEHFRDQGRDALVVYDDLTKHADAYRELSLLLGRPPGREAFPGDIFYVHAELLERACAMSPQAGGGSVTALPIVETTDGDISSYIPTNLISITDGQVYLDASRFERNLRPAVDVGKSVSRVGGAAQPAQLRAVARNLRMIISRFEALETLSRVGLDVDPATVQMLSRGKVLRDLLCQPRFTRRTEGEQIFALEAVAQGWLDGLVNARAPHALWEAARRARIEVPELMLKLDRDQAPAEDRSEALKRILMQVLREEA